jgi:hypothetical protein
MNILFDNNVPRKLRNHLRPHQVTLAKEKGWAAFKNGELLSRAASEFEVLITVDANLPYQQHIIQYQLAVIVLRALQNKLERYLPLVAELLARIDDTPCGQVAWVYESELLRQRDERKGRKK